MNEPAIVIIGAGIAGLSAGCYAQMNGYQTLILEKHNQPGGLCTAWKRKGYTFDGCIHDLAGAGKGSAIHHIWRELGALSDHEPHFHDVFTRIEAPGGMSLTVYADIDRFEQHLLAQFPEDSAAIRQYASLARIFTRFDLFAIQESRPADFLKIVPYLGTFARWGKATLETYARRFRNPFLRRVFPMIQYDMQNTPLLLQLNFLGQLHNRYLGWPTGGSLAFAQAIARRYQQLGGTIEYNAPVEKILVENGRACGVRLADGRQLRSGRVISAADGFTTIYRMLDGQHTNARIDQYYTQAPDDMVMGLQITLGVNRDLSHEPRAVIYLLDQPVDIGQQTLDRLDIEIFSFDPTLAPAGKSVLKVLLPSSYSYWKTLAGDPQRYRQEKERVAQQVLSAVAQRFPGLNDQIEVIDVATLLTTERYTGNYHGMQPWIPKNGVVRMFINGLSRTLPGLDNFYMTGHWAGCMVGVSTVAIGSRKLIQQLCRQDSRRFSAQIT